MRSEEPKPEQSSPYTRMKKHNDGIGEASKLKNYTEKHKVSDSEFRVRDSLLVGFLSLQSLISVLGILYYLNQIRANSAFSALYNVSVSMGWPSYSRLFVLVLALLCAYGLWNWHTWGYKGFIVVYGMSIVFALMSGNMVQLFLTIFAIVSLQVSVNDKKEWFD